MTQTSPPPVDPLSPPRRRRRLPLWLKLGGLLFVVLVAMLLALPAFLSTEIVRAKVERRLAEALDTEVRLAEYDLGWTSFSCGALEVGHPRGFAAEGVAIALRAARGRLSLWSLLRGRVDIAATVEGLQVRVHQKADGRSNLGELLGVRVDVETGPEGGRRDRPVEVRAEAGRALDPLRLDLRVVDGRIDLEHEQHGVLESLRDLDVSLQKQYGTSDLRIEVSAEMHRPGGATPGELGLTADIDATLTRPIETDFKVVSLDLARYRPLLGSFVPAGDVTAFAGVVGGSGKMALDVQADRVQVEGNLNVERPHFAGPLFRDMDIRAEHWVISPNFALELKGDGPARVHAENLRLDLGFAVVRGMTSDAASAMVGGRPAFGVTVEADLGQLLRLGGPIPPWLAGSSGNAHGRAAVAVTGDTALATLGAKLLEQLAADLEMSLDRLAIEGHELKGLQGRVTVAGPEVHATLRGDLAGGPLSLQLGVGSIAADGMPCDLQLSWKNGRVHAPAVALLRYAVPLFAGLDPGGELDFQSQADMALRLRGPLLPAGAASTLAWLGKWSGDGNLSLKSGGFTPSGTLVPLFQWSGHSGRLDFQDIATDFTLEGGFLETQALSFTRGASSIGFRGRTGLDGSIDYRIDLTDELRQHRDGQKVLEALGGVLPEARLGGTLGSPALKLPDVTEQLLQQGAQRAADELLEKGLNRLFRRGK